MSKEPKVSVLERLQNPEQDLIEAYWWTFPSPYEIDTADDKAVRRHLNAIPR